MSEDKMEGKNGRHAVPESLTSENVFGQFRFHLYMKIYYMIDLKFYIWVY